MSPFQYKVNIQSILSSRFCSSIYWLDSVTREMLEGMERAECQADESLKDILSQLTTGTAGGMHMCRVTGLQVVFVRVLCFTLMWTTGLVSLLNLSCRGKKTQMNKF